MKRLPALPALVVIAALTASGPGVAHACGGCFHAPPQGPQAVQVVTDHRMVLSLSAQRTTLWDQFAFSGRPSDFSWILPIRYTAQTQIALASNDFMEVANSLTQPFLQRPQSPSPPRCETPWRAPGGQTDVGAFVADSGVVVLREEVVGPYAVSIVRGTDPMAIRTWLRDNGYAVPAAIEPVIDHYTGLNMDYIALRLRPGEGINRMSPVRVTFEGNLPRLPLRMIAAGVADKVGLSLVVIADARMEATNFPNGELSNNDFVWTFANPGDPVRDFLLAFERLNGVHGGRLWLTESATPQERGRWEDEARARGGGRTPIPEDTGVPGLDAGGAGMTPAGALDDIDVAFEGLGNTAFATRLRADLLGRMLDRDLELGASPRPARSTFYQYGVINDWPTFPPCPDAGRPPTAFDTGASTDLGPDAPGLPPPASSGGLSCAASPAAPLGPRAGALSLLALGLAAARTRRRQPG